jgi:hypothetical protein
VFGEFKQKQPTNKQTSTDFEVLWSTRQPDKKNLNFDFFQMNSDSSGQNNISLNKKQSEARQVPVPTPPNVPKTPVHSSLIQEPKTVASPLIT